MMVVILQVVFWISALGLVFPHAIYPCLLFVLSRIKKQRSVGDAEPTVTLVVSAYNEEAVIGEKIQNALSLDYPSDKFDVMVISDASDDQTHSIVREYESAQLRLCELESRSGKSAGLSQYCPEAKGEILVFTDANSIFRSDALRKLVRHFSDPTIGYSVGRQQYEEEDLHSESADSEKFYWDLELKLKAWESRLSSVVGADGAIYALRKEHFEPLDASDINDFYLPLRVIAKGYRGVFDSESICVEGAAPSYGGEFRRKYRIVNRSLAAVTKVPACLNPFRVGWFAWELFSHKVLRWFSPVFLVTTFLSTTWLMTLEVLGELDGRFFTLCFVLQMAGVTLACLHYLPVVHRWKLVNLAYYFVLMNVAAACGIGLLASGRTIGTWKPQR